MLRNYFALSCFLLLAGCEKPSQLDVWPGERIAEVTLGAMREDVATVMGVEATHGGHVVADSLLSDHWMLSGGQSLTVLYHNDRVIQIGAEGGGVVTLHDISTQSTLEEIRKAFPNTAASMMAHDMASMYFDDVVQGIAFGARTDETAAGANPEGDVISIYVHEPGRELIALVPEHEHH